MLVHHIRDSLECGSVPYGSQSLSLYLSVFLPEPHCYESRCRLQLPRNRVLRSYILRVDLFISYKGPFRDKSGNDKFVPWGKSHGPSNQRTCPKQFALTYGTGAWGHLGRAGVTPWAGREQPQSHPTASRGYRGPTPCDLVGEQPIFTMSSFICVLAQSHTTNQITFIWINVTLMCVAAHPNVNSADTNYSYVSRFRVSRVQY